MKTQYSIPNYVYISAECRHLLSRIFVANPDKRIMIPEIRNHPWFLKNLPRDLIEGAEAGYQHDDPEHPPQSVEEITRILAEARIPPGGACKAANDHQFHLADP
jgi:serine/threonine-protein kinase SRK2